MARVLFFADWESPGVARLDRAHRSVAWRMLHRSAHVRAGEAIVVLGAAAEQLGMRALADKTRPLELAGTLYRPRSVWLDVLVP